MNDIQNVLELDFSSLIISIFLILSAFVTAVTILDKFFKIIGKPIKWFKGKDEDHDLLTKTIKNVETLQVVVEDGMELIKENQDEIKQF